MTRSERGRFDDFVSDEAGRVTHASFAVSSVQSTVSPLGHVT